MSEITPELHELMRDNDGHWYLVPVVYKDTFNEMMRMSWTEYTKVGWAQLNMWRVDGPHSVQFMWPVANQQEGRG